LVSSAGETLGALCAIDVVPKSWTSADLATLRDLAAAAVSQLELRAALQEISTVHAQLRSEHEWMERERQTLRRSDPLTGLLSRGGFGDMLRALFDQPDAAPHALLSVQIHGGAPAIHTASARIAAYAGTARSAQIDASHFALLLPTNTHTLEEHIAAIQADLQRASVDVVSTPQSVQVGGILVSPSGTRICPSSWLRDAEAQRQAAPRVNGQQAQSAPSAAPSGTSVGDLLVVDDFPGALTWATDWLCTRGWRVHYAASVAEALAHHSMRQTATELAEPKKGAPTSRRR
jgi:GAF domain-containing protein